MAGVAAGPVVEWLRRRTPTGARLAVVAVAVVGLFVADPVPAGSSPLRVSCAPGTVPVLVAGGSRVVRVRRDARGRARCAPAKVTSLPAPGPAGGAQLGRVADSLATALRIDPAVRARLERRLGRRRVARLLDVGLSSWRSRVAVAAAARTAGRRGRAAGRQTETFSKDGVSVTLGFGLDEVSAGGKLGYTAGATVDGSISREGLEKLGGDTAKGLPKELRGAKLSVDLRFEDLPSACPDGAGVVAGTLRASGLIRVTVTTTGGDSSVTAEAEVEASYRGKVGDDARWKTIDDVDVRTRFSLGATGRGTETWRARRTGSGFGREAITDAKDGAATRQAIERDAGQLAPGRGGIWGPQGGINWSRGASLWDLRSVANVKGLIATSVANYLLTLAAVEYVRKATLPRLEKHWYDDEACLKLDAAAADRTISPGGTTTITARDARAADGTPVPASLSASGEASVAPDQAALPAAGSAAFTLTAPAARPVKAAWKVVALSRAGKRTVTGTLMDRSRYRVTLALAGTATLATHDASADLAGVLLAEPQDGTPQRWTASGPVSWSNIVFTPKIPCTYGDPVAGGVWTVTITDVPPEQIQLTWTVDEATRVNASAFCPPSAVIPDQVGPRPIAVAPTTFTLPAAGGTRQLTGTYAGGEGSFSSDGTLKVEPETG